MQFDRKFGIGSYFILAPSEAEKGGKRRKGEEKTGSNCPPSKTLMLSPPPLRTLGQYSGGVAIQVGSFMYGGSNFEGTPPFERKTFLFCSVSLRGWVEGEREKDAETEE